MIPVKIRVKSGDEFMDIDMGIGTVQASEFKITQEGQGEYCWNDGAEVEITFSPAGWHGLMKQDSLNPAPAPPPLPPWQQMRAALKDEPWTTMGAMADAMAEEGHPHAAGWRMLVLGRHWPNYRGEVHSVEQDKKGYFWGSHGRPAGLPQQWSEIPVAAASRIPYKVWDRWPVSMPGDPVGEIDMSGRPVLVRRSLIYFKAPLEALEAAAEAWSALIEEGG